MKIEQRIRNLIRSVEYSNGGIYFNAVDFAEFCYLIGKLEYFKKVIDKKEFNRKLKQSLKEKGRN